MREILKFNDEEDTMELEMDSGGAIRIEIIERYWGRRYSTDEIRQTADFRLSREQAAAVRDWLTEQLGGKPDGNQ